MLLTRCPHCATVFRVSEEQLAARNGRVRCGQCRTAFNASEHLLPHSVEESPAPSAKTATTPTASAVAPVAAAAATARPDTSASPLNNESVTKPPIAPVAELPDFDIPAWEDPVETRREPVFPADAETTDTPADGQPILVDIPDLPEPEESPVEDASATPLIDPPTADEAQAAELIAPPADRPVDASPSRPVWPFVVAGVLLSLLLVLQLTHRFRTEISVLLPGARSIYNALGVEVPLPRQSELIGIESSDLQADTGRNLLILNAQLKNRAPYSQSYPALEVTLTDARDAVLLRRVLQPKDYLTQDSPPLFAPNAELPVKLWLDPGNTGATGYRLYVFYP